MTTIAYKDGVIAGDSRVTAENFIVDDEYDKHVIVGDIHFFCSGSTEFMVDFWMKKICPKMRFIQMGLKQGGKIP